MSTVKPGSPASAVSLMTTELNSLSNGNSVKVTNSPFNNATSQYQWGRGLLKVIFGSAPTSGTLITAFASRLLDGTNWPDFNTGTSIIPAGSLHFCSFVVEGTGTTQWLEHLGGPISLEPFQYKFGLLNQSGVAFSASGSILYLVPWNDTIV